MHPLVKTSLLAAAQLLLLLLIDRENLAGSSGTPKKPRRDGAERLGVVPRSSETLRLRPRHHGAAGETLKSSLEMPGSTAEFFAKFFLTSASQSPKNIC